MIGSAEQHGAEVGCCGTCVDAGLDPGAVPRFPDAARTLHTLDGAAQAGEALARFEAGWLVVAVSRLAFKCPAPYEGAFLAMRGAHRRGKPDQKRSQQRPARREPTPTGSKRQPGALSRVRHPGTPAR